MESFIFVSARMGKEEFDRRISQVFRFLWPLEMEYHGFCRWYWSRVVPSILTGSKEIIIAEYRGQITGVAILKNEAGEKKNLYPARKAGIPESGNRAEADGACIRKAKYPEALYHSVLLADRPVQKNFQLLWFSALGTLRQLLPQRPGRDLL